MNRLLPADALLRVVDPPARVHDSPDYAGMLAAIAAGDRSAETALVKTITPPLQVVLRRRAPNGADIEDLCQEALLVVLAAAREGRIDEPRALVQFALETARRLASNAGRKAQRQQTGPDEAALAAVVDGNIGGVDLLMQEAIRRGVQEVLHSLSNPRDRQLLYSYYLEEVPSADLQVRFSMNSAQLGRVLHRARQRFGEVWRKLRPAAAEY